MLGDDSSETWRVLPHLIYPTWPGVVCECNLALVPIGAGVVLLQER
jgi:hypothetical protein